MSIEITGINEIQKHLNTLSASLDGSQMKRKMTTIGHIVQTTIDESFQNEQSPFGEKWAPRKSSKRTNKLLFDIGTLRDNWSIDATSSGVTVGTNTA